MAVTVGINGFGRCGPWREPVGCVDSTITVGTRTIRASAERDPREVGSRDVIEATGRFRDREAAAAHLEAGAREVLLAAPGKDVDAMIVPGVNDAGCDPQRPHVVSGPSCTTNCVAPMVDVLHRAFTVRRGVMTTIHSYTNDRVLLDTPHSDLRRARAAAVNLIPTTSGAARAVGRVIPQPRGELDGIAVQVPVADGSL